ncbi:MAG: sigma-54-dependent Fis family transcriptional regulator [Treponema sp.]|nr:sigma-54-dependent Fis family transcriptional regulator [Treponema sp.]
MNKKQVFLISTNVILIDWCTMHKNEQIEFQVLPCLPHSDICLNHFASSTVIIDASSYTPLDMLGMYRILEKIGTCNIAVLVHERSKTANAKFIARYRQLFPQANFFTVFSPDFPRNVLCATPDRPNVNRHVSSSSHMHTLQNVLFASDELPLFSSFDLFSGTSPAIIKLKNQVHMAAASDEPVLVLGESGSGKSFTANYIHEHSPRKNGPFCSINMANFEKGMVESMLFGTERGAYTGAVQSFGYLHKSQNGTMFMDEIDELPRDIQAKFLHVLEHNSYRRLGGTKDIQFDVRFVYATNSNLRLLVQQHLFREDLFYRIAVLILAIPPLREHIEDVVHFARQFASSRNKRLSTNAIERLCDYPWPGNIRQLSNTVLRACAFCTSDVIDSDDIVFDSVL